MGKLIKTLALIALATVHFGCTTAVTYRSNGGKSVSRAPKPASVRIMIYGLDDPVNKPHTVIGSVSVGDTGLSVIDGDFQSVVNDAVEKARLKGADAIKLTSIKEPDVWSTIYRIKANVLVFDEPNEKVALSEEQLKTYLDANRLADVEGIWKTSDGKYRIGIQKQESGAYIAFILESKMEGWTKGEVKMTLEPTAQDNFFLCEYTSGEFFNWAGFATVQGALLEINVEGNRSPPGSVHFLKLYPKGVRSASVGSSSSGTGFAVSPDGYIITAHHVVDDASSIQVKFKGSDWLEAKLVKKSIANDIAVLKVNQDLDNHISFAPYGKLQQGDEVYTIGFPVIGVLGSDSKYTDGTISSLSGIDGEDSLIQTTVAVQPGNSGGPLLNEQGDLVGMITSTAAIEAFYNSTGSLPQNINWAVKSAYVKMLLPPAATSTSAGAQKEVSEVSSAVCLIKAE